MWHLRAIFPQWKNCPSQSPYWLGQCPIVVRESYNLTRFNDLSLNRNIGKVTVVPQKGWSSILQISNWDRPFYILRDPLHLAHTTSWEKGCRRAYTLYQHIISLGRYLGLYHQLVSYTLGPGVTRCTTSGAVLSIIFCKYNIFNRPDEAMFVMVKACLCWKIILLFRTLKNSNLPIINLGMSGQMLMLSRQRETCLDTLLITLGNGLERKKIICFI